MCQKNCIPFDSSRYPDHEYVVDFPGKFEIRCMLRNFPGENSKKNRTAIIDARQNLSTTRLKFDIYNIADKTYGLVGNF